MSPFYYVWKHYPPLGRIEDLVTQAHDNTGPWIDSRDATRATVAIIDALTDADCRTITTDLLWTAVNQRHNQDLAAEIKTWFTNLHTPKGA